MAVRTKGLHSNFENVYIYVADALRYDFIPPQYADRYDVIKTVAGGILSPPGFASLLTGRYPFEHGVYGFHDRLSPEVGTLFTVFSGLDTGFIQGGGQVGEVLGKRYNIPASVSEFSEPFLAVERDLLTHAPYGKDQSTELTGSNERYWRSVCKDRSKLITDYQKAATLSFQRFERRISTLKTKGVLDNTLVVFTSDHGESLGEHGIIGHSSSMTPETAYVPTIVHNTDVQIDAELIGHVDLLPLIAEAIGQSANVPESAGTRLEDAESTTPIRYCLSENPDMRGVWGPNGGYVFVDEGIISQGKWVASKIFVSGAKAYMRRRPFSILSHGVRNGLKNTIVYGNPSFEAGSAEEALEEAIDQPANRIRRNISEETRNRLEEMGYVEQARE